MKLPRDVIISDEKLTHYLLAPRAWDDKSKFLSLAGFSKDSPGKLKKALKVFAENHDAIEDGENEYGLFYRTEGELIGPNKRELTVTVIWFRRHIDDRIHLVTLKPSRGKSV